MDPGALRFMNRDIDRQLDNIGGLGDSRELSSVKEKLSF